MNRKPNIILMVADDHGREALGCYGNPVVETPNLDAIAENGVRFTRAFCTTASCAASRSVILTGKHNHTNGTYGHTHGTHHFSCFPGTITLPALLKEQGYRTYRVGKQHYAPDDLFPFDGGYPAAEFGRDDVRMSDSCRDFIRGEGDGDEPFFLYWCSMNPHRAGFAEEHPLRPNGFGNPKSSFAGDTEREFGEDEVLVPTFLSDLPEVRAELSQYYQSIARLDRGVGRLMEILDEEGKRDDTVVIYISDNGAAFPEAKTTLYEPGMNLPCIVRDPRRKRYGELSDGLTTWADISPTILDLAGADVHKYDFHGESIVPLLDGPVPDTWRKEIYASHTFHEITNYYPMRVVRTATHKFIYNIAWKLDYPFAGDLWKSASWQAVVRDEMKHFGARSVSAYTNRPRFELYDLLKDPDETDNLAEKESYAGMVDDFCRLLRAFQEKTGDPWIRKWEYE